VASALHEAVAASDAGVYIGISPFSLAIEPKRYSPAVRAQGSHQHQDRLIVDGRDVASARRADSYLSRSRGLLGTRGVQGALLISPCNSVHGLGMIYTLDVALLDPDLAVLHTLTLHPFGLIRPRRGVRHVLEAERGAFSDWDLRVGSRLRLG
jgi:uncharacterized membrane protein (UPF0127 family)